MPVECHVIHADMAVSSDVPHVVPVLEHLRERGGRATASSLSAELFLPEPLCKGLLASCAESGLAEEAGEGEQYAITPGGADAIESGRALISRKGMWKVHIARHAAFPEGLAVVRIEDGTQEAGYMPWIKDGQPSAERLGPAVQALNGAKLRPALGAEREAIVHGIHEFEKRIESDLSLRLRVSLGKDGARTVLLASRKGNARQQGRRAPGLPGEAKLDCPPVTIDEAMEALLYGEYDMEWDAENARIAADYDCLSDRELDYMQKTMRLEDVEIGDMAFETASVTAPLFPRNDADAKKWARHLFARMATEYVTREEYDKLSKAIGGMLGGMDTGMGERASHMPDEENGRPSERGHARLFWLIRAMEDWDL